MKKILLASTLLFVAFMVNAQKLDGKWVFEKLKLHDNLIYFDDSDKDKQNLISSWLQLVAVENDQEAKNEINKNKELIYEELKKLYKGMIEFKDMKYDELIIGPGGNRRRDLGVLVYSGEGDSGGIERIAASFEIDPDRNNDDGFDILSFDIPDRFHHMNKLNGLLKANKLILEEVGRSDIKDAFVFYFKKG